MSVAKVPTATSLNDIYQSDALSTQKPRWEALIKQFNSTFARNPLFVSRSPGRVNVIGEHIDYSLYDVLPMAITADVLLAVYPVSGTTQITLANIDAEKFPTRTFDIRSDGDVHIDNSIHEWSNYFKAGLRGALSSLKLQHKTEWTGMQIVVDGRVPAGGGLSSSSAFVCASALAALAAHGESAIDKIALVELAITSERAVGVGGGGMDQAASVASEMGAATYVSFHPKLTVTPIQFPDTKPELAFVIANTFVTSDKHVTAQFCYNLRASEVTLAANVLSKIFGLKAKLPKDASPLNSSLRGFHDLYFQEKHGIEDNTQTSIVDFEKQLQELSRLCDEYLHQEQGYTREELSSILDLPIPELEQQFLTRFPVKADRFKLRQRTLHVFKEAIRVIQFRETLSTATKSESTDDSILKTLGDLLNESQKSCREQYECSCPELDEICELAIGAGAYGSRLTGAGWGGGSVHLVAKNKIDKVKEAWINGYYRKRWPDITPERLEEAIVVSEPSSGAYLYQLSGPEPLLR